MQFIKKIPLHQKTFIEYNLMLLKRKNLLTWFLVGLFISLAIIYFNLMEEILFSVIFGIFAGCLFVGLTYFLAYRRAKKDAEATFQDQKLGELELVYTIDAKGVKQQNNLESFPFTWNRFRQVKETALAFYFFYTKTDALVLTKEAMNESEISHISALIRQYYKK